MGEINKRFKLLYGVKRGTNSGVWDTEKKHNQGVGDELWIGEVVDLLNQFNDENERLKQDLKYFIDITTLTKAIELLDTIYDKYLYASPSDTIAEAKRKGIKECMDTLENYLEDLDV